MKQKYYVVFVGRNPGIYATWDDYNAQVHSFSGCKHNSFLTFEDATNAWNQYQASFLDRTARRATVNVVVRASHRPSTEDSGDCAPALTDRTQIATSNVRQAANAKRVTIDDAGDDQCMTLLFRLLLGLLIFYVGIRVFFQI